MVWFQLSRQALAATYVLVFAVIRLGRRRQGAEDRGRGKDWDSDGLLRHRIAQERRARGCVTCKSRHEDETVNARKRDKSNEAERFHNENLAPGAGDERIERVPSRPCIYQTAGKDDRDGE